MRAAVAHEGSLFAEAIGAVAEWLTAFVMCKREQFAKSRRAWSVGAVVVLGLACSFSFSQAGPASSTPAPTPQATTTTSGSYSFDRDRILGDIANAVSTNLQTLQNNAKLQGFGNIVTAFLLVAMLVWSMLKMMATGRGLGELIGEWVPIFVAFGIVNLFLDRDAAHLIVSTMDTIGAAVGGADMSTLDSAIKAGADPIFRAISAIVDQPRVTSAADSGSSVLGVLSWIGASFGSMIMAVGAKIVAAFILVLAGVVMCAHIIMGFIGVQLVLALAPVMVPFLLFKPLSWLFESWLKFLLGSCMLKIVVAFLLNVAAGLLTAMSNLAQTYYTEAQGAAASETFATDILLLGLMLVFALLATLLLAQAPSLSNGLLSGGAGSVGFGGLHGVSHGMSNRSVGGGATNAAQGMGSAMGQGARNGLSYLAGRGDAKAGRAPSLAYREPRAKAAYATAYRKNSPPKTTP